MLTNNEVFLLAKLNTLEHINAQMLIIFSRMASMQGRPPILDALLQNLRANLEGPAFVLKGKGEGAAEVQAVMKGQVEHFADLIHYYEKTTKIQ